MIVAAQDVHDAEHEKAHRPTAALAGTGQRHPGLARLGSERELAAEARRLESGERVVVGAENVEEVVADQEVADGLVAGEIHDEGDAFPARRGWKQESRAGLAALPLGDQRDLVADYAEEPVAAGVVAGTGEPEVLGHRGRHRRGPEHQAVPDAVASDHDRSEASATAGVGEGGARGSGGRSKDETGGERPPWSHRREFLVVRSAADVLPTV